MSSGTELKKLSDLRVVDLKNELEKLGLEKNGIKAVLIERLQKALIGKGLNPEEHLFEVSNRQKRKQDGDRTTDDSVNCDDDSEKDGPDGSDSMIVTDELGDEDVSTEDSRTIVLTEREEKFSAEESTCNMSENIPNSCSSLNGGNVPSSSKSSTDFGSKGDGRENADKGPDGNTVDNEDSINLDITEEEKLMTEEEKVLAEEEDERREESEKVDKGKENSSEESVKKEEIKNEEESQQKNSVTEASGLVKAEEETNVEEAKEIKEDDKTKSEEASVGKAEPDGKAIKDKKNEITESRNLWVSNLSSHTRATDLKQVFSKHGKVIGAKVVTNARTPGARCYGYVTMANSDDATRCIKHLHRIELHGRMISVEKAKGDATGPLRTSSRRSDARPHERRRTTSRHDSSRDKKSEDKKKPENGKAKPKSEGNSEENKERTGDEKCEPEGEKRCSDEKCRSEKSKSKDRNRSKSVRSHGHRSIHSRSPFRRRHSPRKDVLSFSQIKEERERQRLREKERRIREEAKRRREEALRQRDIDRRQKSEAARLEREREKLRLERERIEREKSELLRMERERQRLERERLEREKEELKMQQKRLEAARRSSKRPTDDRRDFSDKRPALVRSHFDAPPPPRFTEEDRRRERFERERDRERDRDRDRERDRERDRDRPGTGYRARDERRTVDDHRERSSVDWHSGSSQQSSKTFGNIGGPSGTTSRDPWGSSDRKSDSNASWGRTDGNPGESRWVNNVSNMTILGRPPMGNAIATALYQNQPVPPGLGMGISLSSNGPYSNDRFDAYKQSLSAATGRGGELSDITMTQG